MFVFFLREKKKQKREKKSVQAVTVKTERETEYKSTENRAKKSRIAKQTMSRNDTIQPPLLSINKNEMFKIRFHIFISPDLQIDPDSCKIGLFSNIQDWKDNEMIQGTLIG